MLKKITKKFISLTLAAAALVTMTSCGDKKTTSVSKDENGNYIFNEKLDLTVWETQGTDFTPTTIKDSNVVAKWLTEKTNVEITNAYGNDGGQWDSKRTKLIASGNLPHIVHCGDSQGASHFKKLDESGLIWHLTPEMLKKYAPHAWEQIPQDAWDDLTIDGNILGIPYNFPSTADIWDETPEEDKEFIMSLETTYNDVMTSSVTSLWIRDDILKKIYPQAKTWEELSNMVYERNEPIGEDMLDIPINSTEEFIDFLYKIKELNLKENGKTVYAYGYSGDDCWNPLYMFGSNMYGYKNHQYISTWNDTEKKMEVPLTNNLIKQCAKTQNKMVNDGVISAESLANSKTIYNENLSQGLYAIAASLPNGAEKFNEQLEKQGVSFRYRPFVTQVPANKDYPPFKVNKSWTESVCFVKDKLDENALIQVLNWIDTQFTDEFLSVKSWGRPEDGLYEETENGRRFKDERYEKYFVEGDTSSLTEDETMGLGSEGTQIGVYLCGLSKWDPKVTYKYIKYKPTFGSGFAFKQGDKHTENIKEFPPVDCWAAQYGEIDEVVTYWSERGQWEEQFKKCLAVQEKDFDSSWEAAIKNLNSIVDVKKMEEKMTEVAKKIIKQ